MFKETLPWPQRDREHFFRLLIVETIKNKRMELYSVTTTYLKTMLSQGGLLTREERLALLSEIDVAGSNFRAVQILLARTSSSARANEGGCIFNLYFKLKKCYQLNISFSIHLYPFATIVNGSHTTHDESWRQRRRWPSFGITVWFEVPPVRW